MNLQELITKSLTETDNDRDRSRQIEIGVSSLGGCKRQAWHIIQQTPKTNQTESLAAILGTAIHAHISEAIKWADPFGEDFLIEEMVENDKIRGHVDLYVKSAKMVVDWKTKTMKGLDRFPSSQEKWQVNVYANLLQEKGFPVERVALVGIPRDGTMADIKVWQSDYDPKIVDKAFAWLEDVQSRESAPDPERPISFCRSYCSYYDETGFQGCPAKS